MSPGTGRQDHGEAFFLVGIVLIGVNIWIQTNGMEAQIRTAGATEPNSLALTGQLQEAIDHYHEALRLKPYYPDAHNNLEVALAMQQKAADAAGAMEDNSTRP